MSETENPKGIVEGVVQGAKVVKNITKWPVAECGAVGELYSFRNDDDVHRLRFEVHGQDPEFVFESMSTGQRERVSASRIEEIASRGKLCRVEIRWTDCDKEKAWLLSVLDAFIVETDEIITECEASEGIDSELVSSELLHLTQLHLEAVRCYQGASARTLENLRVQMDDSIDHANSALQSFAGGLVRDRLKSRLENMIVRSADRSFRTKEPGKVYFNNRPCSFGDILSDHSDGVDFSDRGA